MKRPRGARCAAPAVALAALGAAAGLWQWFALAPDLANRLRDDAYYEFAWAANLAAGRGPVVSDGTTTSGVQLLWCLVLLPVAALGGAAALPAVAPWLGALLHALAAAAVARLPRDRATAAVVGLGFAGHPLLLRESQNGQETALAVLAAVGLWRARRAAPARFGAAALLAGFARTDLLGLVAALAVWRQWRGPRRWWRAALAPALVAGAAAAVHRALGGGWLQDSALPMAWLWHANFAATAPGLAASLAQQWWFLRPCLLGGPFAWAGAVGWGALVAQALRPRWPRRWRWAPLGAVLLAAAAGARDLGPAAAAAAPLALAARRRRGGPGAFGGAVLAAGLGLAAIVALHWAVRWYPRDYYLAPLALGAALAVQRWGRWRPLLLAAAAASLWLPFALPPERLAGQRELELAGRWLAELLPPGQRVGSFNSGILTFHADVLAAPARRRAVVNLDGVVDARAFAALRQGQLGAWLDAQRLDWLLDGVGQFAADPRRPHANGHWFGGGFAAARDLVEVARFAVPGASADPGQLRLYWRRGRGAAPVPPTGPRRLGALPGRGEVVLLPLAAGDAVEVERPDGGRDRLAAVDAATALVLLVPQARLGTGRLFRAGAAEPLLALPRL